MKLSLAHVAICIFFLAFHAQAAPVGPEPSDLHHAGQSLGARLHDPSNGAEIYTTHQDHTSLNEHHPPFDWPSESHYEPHLTHGSHPDQSGLTRPWSPEPRPLSPNTAALQNIREALLGPTSPNEAGPHDPAYEHPSFGEWQDLLNPTQTTMAHGHAPTSSPDSRGSTHETSQAPASPSHPSSSATQRVDASSAPTSTGVVLGGSSGTSKGETGRAAIWEPSPRLVKLTQAKRDRSLPAERRTALYNELAHSRQVFKRIHPHVSPQDWPEIIRGRRDVGISRRDRANLRPEDWKPTGMFKRLLDLKESGGGFTAKDKDDLAKVRVKARNAFWKHFPEATEDQMHPEIRRRERVIHDSSEQKREEKKAAAHRSNARKRHFEAGGTAENLPPNLACQPRGGWKAPRTTASQASSSAASKD